MRALFICLLAVAGAGAMQGAGPSLRGRVADVTGAVMPGVTVDVTRASVRVATVTTDGEGTFVVNGLREGAYVVTATRLGFQTTTERVRVTAAGLPAPLALMLQTATFAETVRVGNGVINTSWVDVNPGSYGRIRQSLAHGGLPPADAVYIEMLINALRFDYPAPGDGRPFSITAEIGRCPWNPRHELALVGLRRAPTDVDARIAIAFNPARVEVYRLIGDEHRFFANIEWDDRRNAGDIDSSERVTALYEIVRPGADPAVLQSIGPMNYHRPASPASAHRDEWMTVTIRARAPDGRDGAVLVVRDISATSAKASANLGFAAAVAEFGLLLRDSPFKAKATWRQAIDLAKRNRDGDPDGSRAEFIRLADTAASLTR